MRVTDWIIPAVTVIILLWGMKNKVDIFGEFIEGARENLKACADILPTLIVLITAVGMFRASGAAELLASVFSGFFEKTGFPSECFPLALIRPVSGSGALAVFEGILKDNPPDSFAGRVASVMLGSTETTFYTIAVYYGAVRVKKTKHTLPAALAGDLTGFIVSVLAVNLLFGRC